MCSVDSSAIVAGLLKWLIRIVVLLVAFDALGLTGVSELLRQLHVPTLILAWEDDTAHPVSTATELADTLPDVRDLVICTPDDISKWELALGGFVADIVSLQKVGRQVARSKRGPAKRKRAAGAAS